MDEDDEKNLLSSFHIGGTWKKEERGLFCERRMISASSPSKALYLTPPEKNPAISGGGRGGRGHRRRISAAGGEGGKDDTPGDSCAA